MGLSGILSPPVKSLIHERNQKQGSREEQDWLSGVRLGNAPHLLPTNSWQAWKWGVHQVGALGLLPVLLGWPLIQAFYSLHILGPLLALASHILQRAEKPAEPHFILLRVFCVVSIARRDRCPGWASAHSCFPPSRQAFWSWSLLSERSQQTHQKHGRWGKCFYFTAKETKAQREEMCFFFCQLAFISAFEMPPLSSGISCLLFGGACSLMSGVRHTWV